MEWHVATGWRSGLFVDTLRLGVYVDFSGRGCEVLQEAKARAELERSSGPTEEEAALCSVGGDLWKGRSSDAVLPGQIRIGGFTCEVRRTAKWYEVILATGDWSAEFSTKRQRAEEQKAPGCLVTFRSAALAERGHVVVVSEFLRFVEGLGAVERVSVSRLDLAVDVASSEPSLDWLRRDQLVTKAVTSGVRFSPLDAERAEGEEEYLLRGFGVPVERERSAMDVFEVRGIRSRRRLSSIEVGSRGRESAFMRLYDKWLQSQKMQLAHVRPAWLRQGWDGVVGVLDEKGRKWGTIWRVEFEMGREWLLVHGVDTYADLLECGTERVWAKLTRDWLRVVQDEQGTGVDERGRELGVARREGREVTPFWRAVQLAAPVAARPLERVALKGLRVTDALKASAAGTLATFAAGAVADMDGYADTIIEVALVALEKIPKKLLRMSIERQKLLKPDVETGEVVLSADRALLTDLLMRRMRGVESAPVDAQELAALEASLAPVHKTPAEVFHEHEFDGGESSWPFE